MRVRWKEQNRRASSGSGLSSSDIVGRRHAVCNAVINPDVATTVVPLPMPKLLWLLFARGNVMVRQLEMVATIGRLNREKQSLSV